MSTVVERWLINFDLKLENARCHIRAQLGDQPFLLVLPREQQFYLVGLQREKMTNLFYDDLQLTPPLSAPKISMEEQVTLDEIAEMDCENILFLVHPTQSDSYCAQLEEQWKLLRKNNRKKQCLFIRHNQPWMYNAAIHESLVDQTVRQFIRNSGSA